MSGTVEHEPVWNIGDTCAASVQQNLECAANGRGPRQSGVGRDECARQPLGESDVGGIVGGGGCSEFVRPLHQRAGRNLYQRECPQIVIAERNRRAVRSPASRLLQSTDTVSTSTRSGAEALASASARSLALATQPACPSSPTALAKIEASTTINDGGARRPVADSPVEADVAAPSSTDPFEHGDRNPAVTPRPDNESGPRTKEAPP